MNLVALVGTSVAAYVLGMLGLVMVVAADKDSRSGPGLTFVGWVLMVLAGMIVIGILAEIGNNTS
jgi:hypothetical protein